MRIPNYTKQELCDAIYRAVLEGKAPLSRLDICRAIGRNKSEHIINMIKSLAAGGWLIEVLDKDKFDRPTFKYTVGQLVPNCEQVA